MRSRARRAPWLVSGLLLVAGCSQSGTELLTPDAGADVRAHDGDLGWDAGPRDGRAPDRGAEGATVEAGPRESGSLDAADGSSADACVACAGDLSSWCSVDAGLDCPPDLGAPTYDAWLAHHVDTGTPGCPGCGLFRYDGCFALAGCPETVYLEFSQGKDCGEIFVFDVATKKLMAAEAFCDSLTCSSLAVEGCLPDRCFPGWAPGFDNGWGAPSTLCPPFPDFTIGGTVSGLTGTGLVLENEGEHLPVAGNGSFAFAKPLVTGSPYAVGVFEQPSGGQYCAVAGGSGTVPSTDVTTVVVTCAPGIPYTIGGTVTGLQSGDSLVLQNNLADDVTMSADGTFTFPTSILEGATYSVTISTLPSPPEYCTVTNRSGTVGAGDVTNVVVSCFAVPSDCGRFATGFTGSWSTASLDPYSSYVGISGYVPAGGAATIYLSHRESFDEYDSEASAYVTLASAPVAMQKYGSTAWMGGALWAVTSGEVLEYSLATGTWSTAATGLVTENDTQTTSDDAGNLWAFASGATLLEYDVAAGTTTLRTLTTGFSGLSQQRITYDSCSGLLYLADASGHKFYSYDPASGIQTKLKGLPGAIPFRDGFCGDRSGHVFAVTDTSTVYQYTISSGVWTALPAGGPTGGSNSACGVGADGYLYATEGSSPTMYAIELN
jgi:hypothetical protein